MSIRTHELFPSRQEMVANPDLLYSDHLPVEATFPLPNGYLFRLISWNILGFDYPSGFHPDFGGWETPAANQARYARIFAALEKFIANRHPHMILLQEAVASDREFFKTFKLAGYTTVVGGEGLVTLVRDDLTLKRHEYFPDEGRTVSMKRRHDVEVQVEDQTLVVNNVHTQFYESPENHETYYRELLKHDGNKIYVVLGDTNSRIVPRDKTLRPIQTGVVPMGFNQSNGVQADAQLTDFPDGGFYAQNHQITQLDTAVLDYRTGDVYTPAVQANLPTSNRFVMTLHLDPATMDPDLETLDQKIKTNFTNEPLFLVRPAAKDNNERGFGIRLSDGFPLHKMLKEALQGSDLGQHIQQGSKYFYGSLCALFFVPENKKPEFNALLDSLIANKETKQRESTYATIDDCIKRLQRSRWNIFLRTPKEKIDVLKDLKTHLSKADPNRTLAERITAWENTKASTNPNKTNVDIILQRRNRFAGFLCSQKVAPSTTETMLQELKQRTARG